MQLKDIMTRNVATVQKNMPIHEAARLMKDVNVGSVPVLDGDRLVGIITDRDIVLNGVANGNIGNMCSEYMTTNLVVGSPDMDVHEAAKIMADKQIRRLPVVENGRLVGIVSLGDIATEPRLVNEAGEALNDISKPSMPFE